MSETVTQAGGGTQFHVGTGSTGTIQYRWLDSPNKGTAVSANDCSDFHVLGSSSSYGVGDTNYHTLSTGRSSGDCFVLQGRTQPGPGQHGQPRRQGAAVTQVARRRGGGRPRAGGARRRHARGRVGR